MITGQIKKEAVVYRQIEALNYSSIKTFMDDGPAIFYKEFFLKEKEEEWSDAMVIGSIVDDIILNYEGDVDMFHQHFDQKYSKFSGVKSSAQAFLLADFLFDELAPTIKDGVVTGHFETAFKNAFDKAQAKDKYKGKTWDKGLEDFNKVAKDYYELKVSSIGKVVVDERTLTIAENVAKKILGDSHTEHLFDGTTYIIPKLVHEFEVEGVKCKMEIDFVEVDHPSKIVTPWEMKCIFNNEQFPYSYIKNRYFLQQGLYSIGMDDWMEKNFPSYKFNPFKYVVGDTSVNRRRPLIYSLSGEDMRKGINGFSLNGHKYKGVNELVREIKWHTDNQIWDISKEAYDNNGQLKLEVKYE